MRKNGFLLAVLLAVAVAAPSINGANSQVKPSSPDFGMGTATPSEECGACHVAIYREYAMGFGGDLTYKDIIYRTAKDKLLTMPAGVSTGGTAHALAGLDPFPVHARGVEVGGQSCNVCHFPIAFQIPDLENIEVGKPQPRPVQKESGGVTCASCHLTPDGKIRGPYEAVDAPHDTVVDPKIQTAGMCAYCHSLGKRVPGKQTQTFLEWRDDFHKQNLGTQHCQDCHMPRTTRKAAEEFDVPVRAVARHLWTGGHSPQRVRSALSLTTVQPEEGKSSVELHVISIGAGHSVPSGSNRRGMYLAAEVMNAEGQRVASREWLFAPYYADRPDDKAFLEQDKSRPDAVSAMQADAQGPHEKTISAGEDRTITWTPNLKKGNYIVKTKLIYDLNRYNERTFTADQTEINKADLPLTVK